VTPKKNQRKKDKTPKKKKKTFFYLFADFAVLKIEAFLSPADQHTSSSLSLSQQEVR
jgi:hypothetical protein